MRTELSTASPSATGTQLLPPLAMGDVSDPVVSAHDLSKVYGKGDSAVTALNQVSLEIGKAEFTAIMGPSGSGKSTLMHCLAGLDTASGGSIILEGADLSKMKEKQLTRLRRDSIGFIFQSFNLVPTLNAKENITLPADIAGKRVDPARLQAVVDAVGLSDRLTHRPAELSGGQQQRVACARALVTEPAVVFADEPTGNLDSKSTLQVLAFLRQAVDQFRQTVVMVTHEADAAAWADRVIFLADGEIAAELRNPNRDSVLDALRELGDQPEPESLETIDSVETTTSPAPPAPSSNGSTQVASSLPLRWESPTTGQIPVGFHRDQTDGGNSGSEAVSTQSGTIAGLGTRFEFPPVSSQIPTVQHLQEAKHAKEAALDVAIEGEDPAFPAHAAKHSDEDRAQLDDLTSTEDLTKTILTPPPPGPSTAPSLGNQQTEVPQDSDIASMATEELGEEALAAVPLEEALEHIAPSAQLPETASRVIDQAQQILEELPGSVIESDNGDSKGNTQTT